MPEAGWVRHAVAIGRFEFRRTLRTLWRDKARLGLMALGLVIPSLAATAVVVLFHDVIRSVETLPVRDQLRGTVALFWLFGVFLVGQRVVSARTRIEAEPLVLTTVSARTAAGGLLVAECLRLLAYLCLPVVLVTGVAVGVLGSPASLVFVPAAAVLFAAVTVVVGSACGYAVALLVATSRFVARHKTVLGGAGSVVLMGAYFLLLYPQVGGVSASSLSWVPVGWLVDLAATGAGLGTAPLRAVGAVLTILTLLTVGSAVIDRETTALWFVDPVSVDDEPTPGSRDGSAAGGTTRLDALSGALKPLAVPHIASRPVRRVAEWVLLRTRRDPNRLLFLLIPVFVVVSQLAGTIVRTGRVGPLLAPVCAVALPWLAGALFAMNPLGDEGAMLPTTLTALPGRQYVRGLALPGLVFGLPVAIAATAVATAVSPYTVIEGVGLVGLAVYLTCVSTALAPAIGMSLPRFSAISVGQSRAVLPPRLSAVAAHIATTAVPGAALAALLLAPRLARTALAGLVGYLPALLFGLLADGSGPLASAAGWFTEIGGAVQTIPTEPFQRVGSVALLVGGVVVASLAYRYAVGRFERYSPVE